MRRFTVYRRGDLSATHNADQVNAPHLPQYEGVVFTDGTTVLRWLTAARSTSVWADFETMWRIHGHDDPNSKHHTEIVWHDGASAANVVTVPVLPTNAEDERIVDDLIRQHKRLEDYRLRETEKGLVLERRHDPSFSSYLDGVKTSFCPECGQDQGVNVEDLQTEVERLRVLAQAVDEFVSAAECRCCGGVPYCDHHVEKKAVNEKGRAMTEALREVKP